MACKEETSVLQKGSDLLIDYCCSVCEDNDTLTEAQFYCGECSRWFCDQCVSLHGPLYRKHTTLGRNDIRKWPVARGVAELLSQCEEHKGKKIKMFCAEHSQLCCTTCVLLDHRQCKQVTQITSEDNKTEHEDLQQLTADVTYLTQRLMKLIAKRERNIKSLQDTFDKIVEEIALMRQKFNAALDSLEQRTVNEGRALVSRLQESLQADVDSGKTALNRMQSFQEASGKIGPHDSKLSTIAFMKIQKELSISDSFLRTAALKSDSTLSFTPNTKIEQCFATVTSFGNTLSKKSDAILTTTKQSLYNIQLSGELTCEIRCICEMANGNIIIGDYRNKKAKLLNNGYLVISHLALLESPVDVCIISDKKVAVALYNFGNFHEIHYLTVTTNSLVENKTFIKLNHPCTGIQHYNGQLYITSRKALYRYTLTGIPLDKLYEDTSASDTVYRCAVNAGGDKIYVVNFSHSQVLTLNMCGQLLAFFTDPELQRPIDVHVTESGQVLVCGYSSKNIIQLNSEGTEKIANVASLKEGNRVLSLCMFRRTRAVLVGRYATDDLVVFDTK